MLTSFDLRNLRPRKKMKNILSFFLISSLIISCGYNPDKPYNDTPTSGKVNIAADETLLPLARAQLDTFHGLYRYATISIKYKSESDLFKLLVNDSVKVIMSARKLNLEEESYFKSRHLVPNVTKVAIDAIAVIINKGNPDSLLSISQLKMILKGKNNSWRDINKQSVLGDISFVFDQNGSSTVRYLKDSLMDGMPFPSNCFATNSCTEVIEYVQKNKNAIGVIGVSWISDGDDAAARRFLSKVTVASLANGNDVGVDDYYKPFQAEIALGQYPLVREVYMINREGRAGLGTGFVSFVAGDQGQRIVRLLGMLPATMPVRIVKI